MGIKLITLVIQEALRIYKKCLLQGVQEVRSEHDSEQFYKNSIDDLLNDVILGNEINKHKCDLPLEDNSNDSGRIIGILNFEDTKVRKIADHFDKTLQLSCDQNDDRDDLGEAA